MAQLTENLLKHTIHNPANAAHFMRLKPVQKRVRVLYQGAVIAETTEALRLQEIGNDVYDPALYLPRDALVDRYAPSESSSHCPLKGDAEYLSLTDAQGDVIEEDIAWFYQSPLDFAAEINGRVSFYTTKVTVEEAPV
ncbi:hypothetical protein ACMU_11150 [Actibacterium mucosum KCTC 23349]|uniref:DUF427 domain-containing protein n=1 Tax=Actibacterium mucosum KCTC 23349 TaxID=1454373 RepID=A0A037ZHZ9_9RHOB|nr:DUF427 domain-containing protein [Actibacterium mucosum]KAJ55249.1 hypothetical protein ACMU_11150 [Actibacterium mucosum KCTC 23349]